MKHPGRPTAATTHPGGAERLSQSRLAILEFLQRTRHGAPHAHKTDEAPDPQGASRWRGVREAARRYWDGHPARLVAGLATPMLSHWGRRHPLALVALATGAGALLVLARPWKLISVTGVLVAALKSPHLASLAMSALSASRTHTHDRPPR